MKRWHILLVIGLAGVASLLLATFEQLVPGQQLSFGMRLLILIQPAILTVAAVATGQALAAKLGLGAPLVDSWLTGGNPRAVLGNTGAARTGGGHCRRPADDRLFIGDPAIGRGCGHHGKNDRV